MGQITKADLTIGMVLSFFAGWVLAAKLLF
jgi:hypothetical protein